jgi:uncharacterized repeat protein (TIGR01451 family)
LEPLENRRLLAVATDLVNLSGRVFDDLTGDGFSVGEQVASASLTLYRNDGDQIFEPGAGDVQVSTATTNADGRYTFERLPAGSYFILQPTQTVGGKTLQRSVSPLITVSAEQVAGQLIRTIDGFDGQFQSVVDNDNDGQAVTSTAAAPEAIGGSRDLLVNKTSDIGSLSLVVNDPVSPNLLQVRSDAFGGGRRVVIWDGAGDNAAIVDDNGLGSIDLTSGGTAAGLRLVIGADLPSGSAIVRLYSNDGVAGTTTRVSTATLNIPQLATQPTSVEFLPFTSFSQANSATQPADLTNIGAIEFEVIAGANYDALADLIGTIGPNVIPVADFSNFESVDLNLSKTLVTTTINVNAPVTFRLTLLNEGNDPATNIVVTDVLPAGITYQSNQPSAGGGTFDNTTGRWIIPTLANGATATLDLTGLLTSSSPQTNTAQVTSVDQFDTDSTPNNSVAGEDDQASVVVTPAQINLSLDKTVTPQRPNPGETVTFKLTLTNSGVSDATNIVVQDRLPTGFTFATNDPSSGSFNLATSQWTIPTLGAGQSTTLTLTSNVIRAGSFTNVAEVISADQFDVNSTPGNNLIAEDDQDDATFQTPIADLSLAKTLVGQVGSIGDNVTFAITINNAGPDPATNVQVRELLPAGLSLISATPTLGDYNTTTGIWQLPNLPVTQTGATPVTLTVVAEVTTAGTKTNTAEIINSDQSDPDSVPGNGSAGAAGEEDDIDSVMLTPVTVDLQLNKTVSQSRPIPGQPFTYNLSVQNTSNDNATGVIVSDLLPAGLIFQSATTGENYSPTTGVWNVGSVAAGATRTLAISVLLDPARANPLGTISNTAQITASNQFDSDSTPGNNLESEDDQMSVSITPARADLSLTKTIADPNVSVGEDITFTLRVLNEGPDSSGQFVVADPIPAGATLVSGTTITGVYDPATQRWTVDDLGVNQAATLTLVLRAATSGAINNVAEIITAALPDPDSTPGNSVASEDDQATATAQAQQVNLSLTKSVDNPTPRVGETFSYTITVTNSGPDSATNIVVGETLPAQITLVDNVPSTGTFVTSTRRWTIPTLAPQTSTTLRLDARINSIANITAGDPINTGLVNTAEILSVDQVDPNSTPGNNNPAEDDQDSTSVRVLIADVSVEKRSLTPAPNIGEAARFEIIVRNAGPDSATNLVVRDLLPTGLTYRSDTQSDAGNAYVSATGLWTIPLLASGASTTLTINADVTASGSYTNTAELIAVDQDDPDSTPNNNRIEEDDQAQAVIETPIIDLMLRKTSAPARPSVGSEVTFTLEIENTGPDDATGVVVSDELPVGFEFISSNQPSVFSPTTGLWEVGSLPSGQSQSLQIRGILRANSPFENRTQVIAADQFDRDSTPNNGFDVDEDDDARVTITPAQADLSLTKRIDNERPNVGDDVTFTFTVNNTGPDAASDIQVRDTMPPGLTNIRAATQTGSYNVDDQIWNIPQLAVGGTATLTLTATLDVNSNNSTTPLVRTNYAEIIRSSQFDPDSTPNNGSDDEDDDASVTFLPQLIDLALTKTIDTERANVGETVEFTVRVRNDGPTDATGVIVLDSLPAGLTFVSAAPQAGDTYSSQTGRWTIPSIPADTERTLILRGRVTPSANNIDEILALGIVNVAEVIAADQPDFDSTPSNGVGEDDYATAALAITRANLSLTKSVDIETPDENEIVTFLVNLQNAGPDIATNVIVQETLPPGLADVQITPLSGTYNTTNNRWTVESLGVGESAVLQVRGRVTSPNIVSNRAEIMAVDQFDPNSVPGNGSLTEDDLATAQITPRAVDISVAAVVTPEEILIGDTVTLTVTVRNGQPITAFALVPTALAVDRVLSDATNVLVGISIPDGLTLISVDPAGEYDPQTQLWQVGGLAAGASRELTLTFQVDALSQKTFEIEVLATDQFDVDSTAGNDVPTEDDQTSVTIRPPRTLSKRTFLAR